MSTKAIYEAAGKQLLNKYLASTAAQCRCVNIEANTDWEQVVAKHPWLLTEVSQTDWIRSDRHQLMRHCSVWLSNRIN
jgi:hypothetical protein